MKNLGDIIQAMEVIRQKGPGNPVLTGICQDSREVVDGSLFVAVRGTRVDGHRFIPQAVQQGARAVVCENLPGEIHPGVSYLKVKNSAVALGLLASAWYDHPSSRLRLVGVTGTNGKTSIATLLYALYLRLGYPAGLVSTIEYRVLEKSLPARHTTPDALTLNALLAEMVRAGAEYVFMEVSSHAAAQHRISGITFSGGIFTNITRDHLDYHGDFDEYIRAKKSFFDWLPAGAFALVNADEKHSQVMVQNTAARVRTFGLNRLADYRGKIVEISLEGMMLRIGEYELWTPMIGHFYASNLLAVYGAALEMQQKSEEVVRAISELRPVRGRFETLRGKDGKMAVVDYAHTPDALENVLKTLSRFRDDNHRIMTVVGAGGDRDRGKRPMMAKIAADYSDRVILTSDNPRTEDPEVILDDMEKGLDETEKKRMVRITDRKEAIRAALMMATKGDIVLVAGKGHETYQEIAGMRYPFDDREVIREFMK
ncbi:MAG TPA: UDP-N-acetylmuramoyl-L-alanyl-D-glutamate--2,6-diaminopimelate ligase [Bacteroidetes bacterium]|nr:UDP-N-acetylmuramoyl-L-alanyl-D-glutamate--2,6-diaminopimelate ligase [Bacteroidota bacterium]